MRSPAAARKRRRMAILGLAMLALAGAAALVLTAFEENIVFFYSPSEVQAGEAPQDRAFRLGGLVKPGSIDKSGDGVTVRFVVTDTANDVQVSYSGILPDLFREEQGIVAEGKLGAGGVFKAREVLAKHDENYMPPEVAEALKQSGYWKHAGEAAEGAEPDAAYAPAAGD
ncbi:MAG: cytochrome c maturation protein CcmE [Rhodovibrionaceae bacterium]|nr:cytochrome c maturation protein CcmE [Rhodovibrionaceae bacterium]